MTHVHRRLLYAIALVALFGWYSSTTEAHEHATPDVMENMLSVLPDLRGAPYYSHKVVQIFGQSVYDPLGVPVYGSHDPTQPIGGRVLVTELYHKAKGATPRIYRFLYVGSHSESIMTCKTPDDFEPPADVDSYKPLSVCKPHKRRPEVEYGYAFGVTLPPVLSFIRRHSEECTHDTKADLTCYEGIGSPARILWGGLGGGAIVTMMDDLLPGEVKNTIVELRADVIDAATKGFMFNEHGTIEVVEGDLKEYIENPACALFDVIVNDISGDSDDIYERMMPSPTLSTEEFIKAMKSRLKPNGVLVQHAWTVPQFVENSNRVMNIIYDNFPSVYWARTRESSSMLMFAFNSEVSISDEEIQSLAKEISERTGLDPKEEINMEDLPTLWQGDLKASLAPYRNPQPPATNEAENEHEEL